MRLICVADIQNTDSLSGIQRDRDAIRDVVCKICGR